GFQCAFERIEILVVELLGDGHLGNHLAFGPGNQGTVGPDQVAPCAKTTVGGDDTEEVCGKPCDAGLGENFRQCLKLLIGAEHRAAHQAIEIDAAVSKRVKLIEILFDGVDSLIVACKLKQGGGV